MLSGEENGFPYSSTIFLTSPSPATLANMGPRPFVHLASAIMGISKNTLVKINWYWSFLYSTSIKNYSMTSLMKTSTFCSSENPTHDNYKCQVGMNSLINADYRRSEVCYLLSLSLFGRCLISLDWWQRLCDTGPWKIKITVWHSK